MPCAICLQPKRFYQGTRTLKCGHRFHTECIMKWTEVDCTCPVCREPVLQQREVDLFALLSSRYNWELQRQIFLQAGIELKK